MEGPNKEQLSRICDLAEALADTPPSKLGAKIQALADDGESVDVLTYIRAYFQLPPIPELEFSSGDRIADRYEIVREIGRGGMGIVYLAKQDLTQRNVALKVIHPRLVSSGLISRFQEEIATLGRLDHPGIIRVYDAGVHCARGQPETVFFSMPYIDGIPVDRYVTEAAPSPGQILCILTEICDAVQAAHERSILHRDLKPSNILVSNDAKPMILDFGLATIAGKLLAADDGSGGEIISGFSGTPRYMSPEQFLGTVGEFGDGQSIDVYALGVIAFELLTGHSPYDLPSDTSRAMIGNIIVDTKPHLLSEFIESDKLDAIVGKALRKDPADRYFTVSSFAKALSRLRAELFPADLDIEIQWHPTPGALVPSTEWTLDRKLGQGGIGEVWLAHHPTLHELRVFKFCNDENKVRSLKREACLFRLLKEKIGLHPNIVRLHDVSLDDPPYFIAMDYVTGGDLFSWSEGKGGIANIPIETRLEIIAQAAETLQAAHDAGIIHRDIKPSNLLIESNGTGTCPSDVRVYLADFGIGQLLSLDELSNTRLGFTRIHVSHETDSYVGSQRYIAPELLSGDDATARSDIYSIGIVLYQALVDDFTKALPFDWHGDVEDHLLREDLEHCLFGDPRRRFSSGQQLANSIRNLEVRRRKHEIEEQAARAREKAAYRRGIYRAAGIAAVIVVLVSGLAIYAFSESARAKAATNLSKLEAAAAIRNSAHAGRAFKSMQLIDEVAKAEPMNPRVGDDWIASKLLSDLRRQRHALEPPAGTSSFAISPDFDVSAYADADGNLVVARLKRGRPQTTKIARDIGSVLGLLICRGSQFLAVHHLSAPDRSLVSLFQIPQRGGSIPTPSIEHLLTSEYGLMTFSDDGSLLAVADKSGRIAIINCRDDTYLSEPLFSESFPFSRKPADLDFRPGKSQIAISSEKSQRVLLWDWETKEMISFHHPGVVPSIAWDPFGTHLASACDDGTVYLREVPSAISKNDPRHQEDPVEFDLGDGKPLAVSFTSVGDAICAIRSDRTLEYWNWSTGENVFAETDIGEAANSISFSTDDSAMVHLIDGKPVFWEVLTGRAHKEVELTPLKLDSVGNIDFDSSGSLLLASFNVGIFVVDVRFNRVLAFLKVAGTSNAFFGPGDRAIYSSSLNGPHCWPIKSGGGESRTMQIGPNTNLMIPDGLGRMALQRSPDVMAVVHKNKVVVSRLSGHDSSPTALPQFGQAGPAEFDLIETGQRNDLVAIHPSGRLVVTGRADNSRLAVYDRETSEKRFQLDPATAICFSPHGHYFASVDGGSVRVVSCASEPWSRVVFQIDFPSARISAIAVSNRQIAIGLESGKLWIKKFEDGTEIQLDGGQLPVAALAFSRDRMLLASTNMAGRLHVWDLAAIEAKGSRRDNLDVLAPPKVRLEIGNLRTKIQTHLNQWIRSTDEITKSPLDAALYRHRARASHGLMWLNSAADDYAKCDSLWKEQKISAGERANMLFHWSRTFVDDPKSWDLDQANTLIHRALLLEPANTDYLFLEAIIHYFSGSAQLALDAVDRSLEVAPRSGSMYRRKLLCKAGCLYKLGMPEVAKASFDESQRLSKSGTDPRWIPPVFEHLEREIQLLMNEND